MPKAISNDFSLSLEKDYYERKGRSQFVLKCKIQSPEDNRINEIEISSHA